MPKHILLALVLTVSALFTSNAPAHEIKPAIVDINYQQKTEPKGLNVKLLVNLESLMAEIGPDHDDTNKSKNSDRYQHLRTLQSEQLITEFASFKDKLISGITLTTSNSSTIVLKLESIAIPPVGDTDLPRDTRIILVNAQKVEAESASWQWHESFGEVIVRANSDSQKLDYAALLAPGQSSDLIHFTKTTERSFTSTLGNYLIVGFDHILPKGLDHVLFVIGLFLLTPKWHSLLVQVTTFTVAHSITLALGATGVLNVSPSIVEPLIALSIVFVCVENLLTKTLGRWRIATIFVFGLLHGLGFAGIVGTLNLPSADFLTAMLGFNIGVEVGQLVVLVLCFCIIGLWFSQKAWYRSHITKPASILLAMVGTYWFLQRTIL